MQKPIGSVILLLLATGCSWQQGNETTTANETSNGVDYRQRVADMPEGPRNALLLRAIVGAQLPCHQIETATLGTDSSGAPAWNVHCADGHDRTVIIAGDGTARILDADPAPGAGNLNKQ